MRLNNKELKNTKLEIDIPMYSHHPKYNMRMLSGFSMYVPVIDESGYSSMQLVHFEVEIKNGQATVTGAFVKVRVGDEYDYVDLNDDAFLDLAQEIMLDEFGDDLNNYVGVGHDK
jgi:hypothetical protein